MLLRIRRLEQPPRIVISEVLSSWHAIAFAAAPLLVGAGLFYTGLRWSLVLCVGLAVVGLGVGYRVVASGSGLRVSRTIYGIPVRTRVFSSSLQFGAEDPPDGDPHGVWIAEARQPPAVVVASPATFAQVLATLEDARVRFRWDSATPGAP